MLKNFKKMAHTAVALLLMTSCQSQSQNSLNTRQMRIAMTVDPVTFDPRIGGDGKTQSILRHLFEPLMRVEADGLLHPAAAESLHISDDGLTYIFTLRHSLWSTGEPVTAHDFEYAWKSIIEPSSTSSFAYTLYVIKNAREAKCGNVSMDKVGVKALDDTHLKVVLEHPAPYFLEIVSNAITSPISRSWAENPKLKDKPVCNGPYVLDSFALQRNYKLVLNANYWDKENVTMPVLDFIIVPDSTTALRLFEKKELDWLGQPLISFPSEMAEALQKENKLHLDPSATVEWLAFYTLQPPFNNPKARKAFALALDRASIAKYLVRVGTKPALSILPPEIAVNEKAFFQDHDVTSAQKLWNEALQEMGIEKMPAISLMYSSKHSALCQLLQQQWKEALGVDVQLQRFDWKVYLDKLSAGDFQIATLAWISWLNDPIYNMEIFKYSDDDFNDTKWHSERYTDLIETSDKTLNPQARLELLAQAEQILMDEMPVTPLIFESDLSLIQPEITGVVHTSTGVLDFRWCQIKAD